MGRPHRITRRCGGLLLVALPLVIALLLPLTAAAAPTWLAPQKLSPDGEEAFEPQAAIGPEGEAIAVWERLDGSDYRIEAAARSAGGAFGAPQKLSAAGGDAADPQVAIGPSGEALAVWPRHDGSNYYVEVASRPAGGVFGAPQKLSAAGGDAQRPQVAFGPGGEALVVWYRSDGSNNRVEVASRPAGGAFGAPQKLSAAGEEAFDPRVAIGPGGEALAVWRRFDGSDYRVEVAARAAGGAFGAPQILSAAGEDAFAPRVAIGPGGEALAVWERNDGSDYRIEAAARPTGGAFGASQKLSAPGAPGEAPQVSFGPPGDGLAVWVRDEGSGYRVEAAGYDVVGPRLDGLSIPAAAVAGQPVSFSVSPFDNLSPLASVVWGFGDGAVAAGSLVSHAYATPGTYLASVTATDAVGNAGTATGNVVVAPPPDGSVSLRILGKRIGINRRGVARLRLRCPADEANPPCRGRLVLRTRGKLVLGKGKRARKRRIVLAKRGFRVAKGRTKVVRLRLRKPKQRLLRSKRRARRVLAIALVRDGAGNRRTVRKGMRAVPVRTKKKR